MKKRQKKQSLHTHINSLWNKPSIQKAVLTLLKEVKKESDQVCTVKRGPKNKTYQKLLKEFSSLRAGKLYYPYLSSGIGNGALIKLMDGSVKYDLINGIGVHPGHSLPKLIKANLKASLEDTIMQGNLQQNHESYKLCKKLTQYSKLDHCFLTSSGAMAVENALKLAFQKQYPKSRIIAFKNCFSGRTLALSQITDKPAYREGLPKTVAVDYIPFYDETDQNSLKKTCQELRKILKKHPKKHAVMIAELIQGEGGYYPGNKEFFEGVFSELKKQGVTIILDEIQTFGRTRKLFAFQTFGLQKYCDIVTIGKLSQVCATLFSKEYKPKPGLISQTFTSSSSAIESALCILDMIHPPSKTILGPKGKLVEISTLFRKGLQEISKKYPDKLNGPYGFDAMVSMTVYNGDKDQTIAFANRLFENGVIGFIAGKDPYRLRFLLPYLVLKKSDIPIILSIIKKTLLEKD